MSRSARFLRGAGWSYGNQITIMVIGLWITPFLLSRLGRSEYGLWLIGLQIINILTLVDFGILAIFPRSVAMETGRAGGLAALPPMIGETLYIVLLQTAVVGLAAGVGWLMLPREWAELRLPLGAMLAGFAVLFPLRIMPAVLNGLQEQAVVNRYQLLAWMAQTALVLVMVPQRFGLWALAWSWLASQALYAVMCFVHLRRSYPQLLPRWTRMPKDLASRFAASFWYGASQLSQLLLDGLDLLVIGKWLGAEQTVIYACTAKLAVVLGTPPQMLLPLAVPALSEIGAAEAREQTRKATAAMLQAMLLMSGAISCLVIVANAGFVRWWVGAEQFGGLRLTALIAIRMLLRHVSLTLAHSAFALGNERRLAYTGLFDGVVSVVGMLVLVPAVGVEGAVWGSLIGVTLIGLPLNAVTLAKASGFLFRPLMAPFAWRILLIGGACFLVTAKGPAAADPVRLTLVSLMTLTLYALLFWGYFEGSPLYGYARARVAPLFSER